MSKPAARVGDMHTCPIPGHGGGPVATGVPSVIIGGQVSATVTSSCSVCGSFIATGSPTVIIGGNLAARLGDSTNHGGVVVQGCPTVLIGNKNTVFEEKEERYKRRLAIIKEGKEKAAFLPEEQKLAVLNAANRLERNNKVVERAKLSNHIYSVPFPNEEKEAHTPPEGWKITEVHKNPDSGFAYAIYESEFETPSKPVLVFRGTDNNAEPKKDWITNFWQAVGFKPKQYRESAALAVNLRETYPNGFDIAGHSKAGAQAAMAALASNQDAYTFNAAGLHRSNKAIEGMTPNEGSEDKIQAFHFKYDPLNWIQDSKILLGIKVKMSISNLTAHPGSIWFQKFIFDALPKATGNRTELAPVNESKKEFEGFVKIKALANKLKSYCKNPSEVLTDLKESIAKVVKFHNIKPYIIDSIEAEKDADKALLEGHLTPHTV